MDHTTGSYMMSRRDDNQDLEQQQQQQHHNQRHHHHQSRGISTAENDRYNTGGKERGVGNTNRLDFIQSFNLSNNGSVRNSIDNSRLFSDRGRYHDDTIDYTRQPSERNESVLHKTEKENWK